MVKPLEELRKVRMEKLEKLHELGIDPYPASWGGFEERVGNAELEDMELGEEVTVVGRIRATREHGGIIFADVYDESGKIQVCFREDVLEGAKSRGSDRLQPVTSGEKDNALKRVTPDEQGTLTSEEVASFSPGRSAPAKHGSSRSEKRRALKGATKEDLLTFQHLNLLDLGDFIGVRGELFRTEAGELTVLARELKLLAKSLRPLPSEWYGLKDVEERYRKRYLDLIMNPEVKERFEKISEIVAAMREYLVENGYTEVLTPSLQPLYGGTLAQPFETFFNALDTKMYLRISNEMYLKRLIAGGFEKVFEFSVDFRNEGLDRFHNPEFLQMETMWAYADYKDNMELAEEMFAYIAEKVLGTTKLSYQGRKIDLSPPWKRVSMVEAVEEETGLDWGKIKNLKEARAAARKLGVDVGGKKVKGAVLEEIFDALVSPKIVQPTLVSNYPRDIMPLAKGVRGNPEYVENFEIFINGVEHGLSYSEGNDPLLLRENFEAQQEMRKKGDLEAHPIDEDFLEAMEYGMPPTSGLGVGMERLFMLLTDAPSIREVIFFPALRPEDLH